MKNKLLDIINRLKQNNQTISFAESCTGGRLASSFVAISGVSEVFNGSVVSYSNQIKEEWLGVDKEILEKYGAVSEPCVLAMLEGISKMAKSDYAVAISGIAGPSGGSKDKPVGTVYIGFSSASKQEVFACFFQGKRENIQEQALKFAIENLLKFIK